MYSVTPAEPENYYINYLKDSSTSVGSIEKMCFSPDGHVIAISWVNGGLALWTVFGSLLFCTLDSTFYG